MKRRDFNKSVVALATTGTLGLNIPQMAQSSDPPPKLHQLPKKHNTFRIDENRFWNLIFQKQPLRVKNRDFLLIYEFGPDTPSIFVDQMGHFLNVTVQCNTINTKIFLPTDGTSAEFTTILPQAPPGTLYLHQLFHLEIKHYVEPTRS